MKKQDQDEMEWEELDSEGMFLGLNKEMRFRIGAVVCSVFLVCALIFLASYYARQKRGEDVYEEMRVEAGTNGEMKPQEQAGEVAEEESQEEAPEAEDVDLSLRRENTVDFGSLQEKNEDIYAWITVPGTQVDYPVLQHPTQDSYYLDHTVERAEGLPGSIYSEAVHPKDFSAVHTVLYGHNMKNGTMFGSLHSYEDETFFQENPYIYVFLPDKTLLYQIYGAVRFSDAYLPEYCNYEDEAAFTAYVEEMRNASGWTDPEVEVPFGSRILTLSTCIANDSAHRYLVTGVLIDTYEK
ncbi:MAG: class B sortase [Lachnospiraceae bacterium]|nr:class B sortase [Lachnospiraceae bacterium]